MRNQTPLRNGMLALAVITTLTSAALAQRPYGEPYGNQHYGNQQGHDASRNVAGQFDYYALVMSWSPSYCAGEQRDGYDPQCDRSDGKRYNFVLHGAWPQFAPHGWPEDCPVRGRAFVPRPVINGMLDIMPSDKLVIHEYRKHGTCSGMEPSQYFDFARRLFNKVQVPDDYRNPQEARFVSPEQLVADFQQVNPWLRRDMIAVDCNGNGNRLREIRICFSKEGQPQSCSKNEDQHKMCRADQVYLPPVRATKENAPAREPNTPVPRPRLIPNARNI